MKYCKDCVFYHPTRQTIIPDAIQSEYLNSGGFCAVNPPTTTANKLPWIPGGRPKCRFFQQLNPFDEKLPDTKRRHLP